MRYKMVNCDDDRTNLHFNTYGKKGYEYLVMTYKISGNYVGAIHIDVSKIPKLIKRLNEINNIF